MQPNVFLLFLVIMNNSSLLLLVYQSGGILPLSYFCVNINLDICFSIM